jgi:hypothetical protein
MNFCLLLMFRLSYVVISEFCLFLFLFLFLELIGREQIHS